MCHAAHAAYHPTTEVVRGTAAIDPATAWPNGLLWQKRKSLLASVLDTSGFCGARILAWCMVHNLREAF
jgi:hypothetical protein